MGSSPSREFVEIISSSPDDSQAKAIEFYNKSMSMFHGEPDSSTDKKSDPEIPIDISDTMTSDRGFTVNAMSCILNDKSPTSLDLLKAVLAPTRSAKLRKLQLKALFEKLIPLYKDSETVISSFEVLLAQRVKTVAIPPELLLDKLKVLFECAQRDEEGSQRLVSLTTHDKTHPTLISLGLHTSPYNLDLFKAFLDVDTIVHNSVSLYGTQSLLHKIVSPPPMALDYSHRDQQFDKVRSEMLREFIASGKMTDEMKNGQQDFWGLTPLMAASKFGCAECVKELIANRVGGVSGWDEFRAAPDASGSRTKQRDDELRETDRDKWLTSTYTALHQVCVAKFVDGNKYIESQYPADHPDRVAFHERLAEITRILLSLPSAKEEAARKMTESSGGGNCVDLAMDAGNVSVVGVLNRNGIFAAKTPA